MRNTVTVATLAVLLGAGMVAFFRTEAKYPRQAESPANANEFSTASAARHSKRALEPVAASLPFESTTNEPCHTNLYARLADGDVPKVSCEQLEPFLTKNRRSVEALLGALRASGDDELLKEAKERFPGDPRVQFAAAFKSASPEERREWLEKFKQSAPDNALANYLLAGDHFKAGEAGLALQEIAAASAKPRFENYLVDFIQNAEEAYRAGGLSDAEAKVVAGVSALLPEQAQLKRVGVDLVELARQYRQAGDEASAQAALEMTLNLGHRLDQTPQVTLIQELVGIAIERLAFGAMDPNAPYGPAGHTVQDQLDALAARRKAMQELTKESDPILKNLSDEDLAHYFERIKLYGDAAALRWVVNKSQP